MIMYRTNLKLSNLNFGVLAVILSIVTAGLVVSSLDLFSVKFIEYMDGRLVATSGNNFGITHPRLLAKNWRTVSVNGDKIFIVTTTGERIFKKKSELGASDVQMLEDLRDELANSHGGYSHISMMDGSTMISTGGGMNGGNFMMSSGTGGGMSSSSSFSSGSMQSSSMQSSGGGGSSVFDIRGMNVNMRDSENFSVSKAGLPYNWSRIFFNRDLVTAILRNGDVVMAPIESMEPAQSSYLISLRTEVKDIEAAQAQQFQNTMQHSMNMVNDIFSSVLGGLPKAPTIGSNGLGGIFGNNFPFGSSNSAFGSAFPMGGGGAVAIAG